MFGEFRHFLVSEFAMLQSQTRLCGRSAHSHDCSKVSMTARTFTRVRGNQRTQAFCAYASFIHEAPGEIIVDVHPKEPEAANLFHFGYVDA